MPGDGGRGRGCCESCWSSQPPSSRPFPSFPNRNFDFLPSRSPGSGSRRAPEVPCRPSRQVGGGGGGWLPRANESCQRGGPRRRDRAEMGLLYPGSAEDAQPSRTSVLSHALCQQVLPAGLQLLSSFWSCCWVSLKRPLPPGSPFHVLLISP